MSNSLNCPLCNNCKSSFEKTEEIFFAYHKCPITNYRHSVRYSISTYYASININIIDNTYYEDNIISLYYHFSYDKDYQFIIRYKSMYLLKRGKECNLDFSLNDIVDYTKTMNCFL